MSYRRVGLTLLMAIALGASLFTPKALADSNARIVRLSYVDGDVQIDRRDGRGFEHAFLNMPLGPGTRVATRDDGRAEIEFEDMSTVRLTPGTLVETQTLDLRSSGGKYTLVDLQDGTAYFNIRKLSDDDDFRVTTGRREFSLTRASRFRVRVDRSQVVLAVFNGEVEVIGEGGRLTVRKNETLTLDLEDPSRYFLAKGVTGDRYDDWDSERDEYRDRYASMGNYRGYSSAYSYGVTDLNYWGSYSYIPGYGYMWRPNYYGVNWDPFQDGGWYWYPGYGWIWVSAYPWGWMPFRYGNWYFIGGHGWCWRPGHHWNSWSPVVVVHNSPPGHFAPTPPPPTGRRDPVIVGRGPQTILPPGDSGPVFRRGNPDALGRRGGTPASGSGPGAVVAPGSSLTATPSSRPGSLLTPGTGSGAPAASGGSGQPAAETGGRTPPGRDRDVELEEQIRKAQQRRSGGNASGSGSGSAAAPGASGGSQSSGGSVSSGSGLGATSPPGNSPPAPAPDRGRSPEPRRDPPHEILMQSSGSSGSASSSSSSSARPSSGSSSGSSGGSSGRSSSSSSSGSSSGHGSSSSSSGSSGGSRPSGGSSSGASHASSGGRSSSSSSSSSSSKGSSPK